MPSVAEPRDRVAGWIGLLVVAALALAVVATASSEAAAGSRTAAKVPCAKLKRQHRKLPARCRAKPSPAPTPSPPTQAPPAPTPPALVGAVKITMPFGRPDVLHASDSQLWIAIHGAGTVFAVDPQSNKITAQMGPENNPVCDCDVSLPGALWTANCGRATGMARIDTQSKAVTATIPTSGAQALALAAGAGAVWAADTNDNVWRIDPVSNNVVAKIPVAPGP